MNNTKSIADIAKVMTEVYAKALRAEEQSRYLMEKSLANMSMSQFLLTEGEEDDAALSQSDVDAHQLRNLRPQWETWLRH